MQPAPPLEINGPKVFEKFFGKKSSESVKFIFLYKECTNAKAYFSLTSKSFVDFYFGIETQQHHLKKKNLSGSMLALFSSSSLSLSPVPSNNSCTSEASKRGEEKHKRKKVLLPPPSPSWRVSVLLGQMGRG